VQKYLRRDLDIELPRPKCPLGPAPARSRCGGAWYDQTACRLGGFKFEVPFGVRECLGVSIGMGADRKRRAPGELKWVAHFSAREPVRYALQIREFADQNGRPSGSKAEVSDGERWRAAQSDATITARSRSAARHPPTLRRPIALMSRRRVGKRIREMDAARQRWLEDLATAEIKNRDIA